MAFIHRFGSSLNEHVHFHVCVIDGAFQVMPGDADADADAEALAPGVIFGAPKLRFHPAGGIDGAVAAQVQADVRRRVLRAFMGRGLLESCDAKDMLAYQHSGFSVDAGVCIEAHDRAALERLLRYCARPPFAMERLRKAGTALVYRGAKQHSEPAGDKRGSKVDELELTQMELIARIAALVPPPRTHRHRYFGVLAPNSPLRAGVTALAAPAQQAAVQTGQIGTGTGAPGVLPLLCPMCGGQMRLIAFITEDTRIRKILDHIGVDSQPLRISPARGPPLGEDCDAQVEGEGVEVDPDWKTNWDMAAQPAPDYEADQRVNW